MLQVGDELLSVDDVAVSQLSHRDITDAIGSKESVRHSEKIYLYFNFLEHGN